VLRARAEAQEAPVGLHGRKPLEPVSPGERAKEPTPMEVVP
jgi:hypothetical protein